MAVLEAKEAYGIEQTCRSLEAVIKCGVNMLWMLWKQNLKEEDQGVILIDASNALNDYNQNTMLWALWNEWPSGAQFTFNCYCHWSTLVIRDWGGGVHLFFSKEGVIQGNPLTMIVYGL